LDDGSYAEQLEFFLLFTRLKVKRRLETTIKHVCKLFDSVFGCKEATNPNTNLDASVRVPAMATFDPRLTKNLTKK